MYIQKYLLSTIQFIYKTQFIHSI